MDTTTKDLAQLITQAENLTNTITDQATRDQDSYNAGYREALAYCRAMFDHGIDIGRAQIIDAITTAQAQTAHDLTLDAETRRKARLARESPDVALPCAHPECRGSLTTHYRTHPTAVLCYAHQPTTRCDTHNDNDRCEYLADLDANRRPEYTGGPIDYHTGQPITPHNPATDPWATLPKANP